MRLDTRGSGQVLPSRWRERDTARAMSQENVEIVRRLYEVQGAHGLDAAFELVDPGLEWQTSPNLPDAGTYRGREEVREKESVWT